MQQLQQQLYTAFICPLNYPSQYNPTCIRKQITLFQHYSTQPCASIIIAPKGGGGGGGGVVIGSVYVSVCFFVCPCG